MRWLFLFILLLNLAYIGWEVSRTDDESAYTNIEPVKNVQTIVLLSEVNQQKKADAQKNPGDGVVSKAGTNGRGGSEQTAQSQDQDNVRQAMAKKTGSDDITGVGRHASKPAVEPSLATQRAVSAQVQTSTGGCYTFGPFRELAVLRRLTRELKPYIETVDFRGREEKEQPLYWVYIKPAKNRKAAIATGNRLKANKINDYFVIRQGKKVNGVSLGYFRNKKGATSLLKRVRKLGFDVVLEPKFKSYTVYWLDYQLADGAKVPDSIFNKYISAAKKDRIKRLGRKCVQ